MSHLLSHRVGRREYYYFSPGLMMVVWFSTFWLQIEIMHNKMFVNTIERILSDTIPIFRWNCGSCTSFWNIQPIKITLFVLFIVTFFWKQPSQVPVIVCGGYYPNLVCLSSLGGNSIVKIGGIHSSVLYSGTSASAADNNLSIHLPLYS